jgi:hypothetical protein
MDRSERTPPHHRPFASLSPSSPFPFFYLSCFSFPFPCAFFFRFLVHLFVSSQPRSTRTYPNNTNAHLNANICLCLCTTGKGLSTHAMHPTQRIGSLVRARPPPAVSERQPLTHLSVSCCFCCRHWTQRPNKCTCSACSAGNSAGVHFFAETPLGPWTASEEAVYCGDVTLTTGKKAHMCVARPCVVTPPPPPSPASASTGL